MEISIDNLDKVKLSIIIMDMYKLNVKKKRTL